MSYEKDEFVECAERFIGTPYLWGGDDPTGIDCSGMVVECLKTIGHMGKYEDATANDLWEKYKRLQTDNKFVARGDIIFWFRKDQTQRGLVTKSYHVAIAKNEEFCITADGGGSKVNSQKVAWENNAYVKVRKINHRGEDFKVVALWK